MADRTKNAAPSAVRLASAWLPGAMSPFTSLATCGFSLSRVMMTFVNESPAAAVTTIMNGKMHSRPYVANWNSDRGDSRHILRTYPLESPI
jgi:hypothetical protein